MSTRFEECGTFCLEIESTEVQRPDGGAETFERNIAVERNGQRFEVDKTYITKNDITYPTGSVIPAGKRVMLVGIRSPRDARGAVLRVRALPQNGRIPIYVRFEDLKEVANNKEE